MSTGKPIKTARIYRERSIGARIAFLGRVAEEKPVFRLGFRDKGYVVVRGARGYDSFVVEATKKVNAAPEEISLDESGSVLPVVGLRCVENKFEFRIPRDGSVITCRKASATSHNWLKREGYLGIIDKHLRADKK